MATAAKREETGMQLVLASTAVWQEGLSGRSAVSSQPRHLADTGIRADITRADFCVGFGPA